MADIEELCERLEVSKEVWEAYEEEFVRIARKYEGKPEYDADTLRKIHPGWAPENVIPRVKEIYCNFLKVLVTKNLLEKFVEVFNNIHDYNQHRRLISSAYIYTRLHTKIPELEDKFLYLCIAVESATRFGEGMRSHNSTQFAKFFVNNLSLESKVLIARKFRDNWTKEHYERFSIYHLSPKSTENIQQIKECSKVSRTALLPRCYDEDKCYIELNYCYEGYCKYLRGDYTTEDMNVLNEIVYDAFRYIYQKRNNFVHEGRLFSPPTPPGLKAHSTVQGIFDVHYKNREPRVVFFELDFLTLCRLYEEALLHAFSGGENGKVPLGD